MNKAILIHPNDDLAVALQDLKAGETVQVDGSNILLQADVKAKHKFATKNFETGDEVHMYDVIVGIARKPIAKGDVLTMDNTAHKSASYQLDKKDEQLWQPPDVEKFRSKTFLGYHRSDGQVGTGNYWLVFPLVFCENRNIETLQKAFERGLGIEKENPYSDMVRLLADKYRNNEEIPDSFDLTAAESKKKSSVFDNIDGIRFITHQGGCGGIRQDAEVLCRLFSGYINNPNVAGATVLSLGCQNAQISMFQNALASINPEQNKTVLYYSQQDSGKEQDLITEAILGTFKAITEADKLTRKPAPLSKLTIGLECGGSDGFSGISANPVLGYVSDMLVALGGSAILSEFPELCGVEQELIDRITSHEDAEKFSHLMQTYSDAAVRSGSGFDMNPSPGNIKDGLITDAMKSAGAARKGGTSPIASVLDYTEYVAKPGLHLLCTPGNDVESTTGLAGSGANVILFTTGLGTPTGNPVVPVIKVSSNTALAQKMPDIIDMDTGDIIRGEKTIAQSGEELLELIIEIASGRISCKAMELEQYDFIPWKRGISL